jgi:folylpolyglutamate synthase
MLTTSRLTATGIKTGRFTSPHLLDRWDCITIDDTPVQESLFLEAERSVLARNTSENIGASEFELLTATAFEIFAREKIEMGVIEVGLGGRLDATNVLENKVVTVISKMGLDHQSFLGNSLGEIAYQKAGIMRAGVPCVLDRTNPPEVREVVEAEAEKVGTTVILSSTDSTLADQLNKDDFEPHQWDNLACAYTAFHLAYTGLKSPLNRILPAILNVRWPGRLQILSIRAATGRKEEVLLDGAHNVQSAEALGAYVDKRLRKEGQKVTWVLAGSKGKALDGILKPLLRPEDCVTAVEFGPVDGMPWVTPMRAQDILDAASVAGVSTAQQYNAGGDLSGALRWAAEVANGGPLVIAGSLYLVSDTLRLLRRADEVNAALSGEV